MKALDELDYDFHKNWFLHCRNIGGASGPAEQLSQLDGWELKEAQYCHALSVFNQLRDWISKTVSISQNLKQEEAKYYLLYGAGRRFNMNFYSYKNIIFKASPRRENPFSFEESLEITRELNVLYMNLRGILDNFAWCFLFEKEPETIREEKLNRPDISLFSEQYRTQCKSFSAIKHEISSFDGWNREIKDRRDPVVHRIPLYVPTAIAKVEAAAYQELSDDYSKKMAIQDWEGAEAALEKTYDLGKFFPFFVHHPKNDPTPLYPTIPTDMANLIRIGNIIEKGLLF